MEKTSLAGIEGIGFARMLHDSGTNRRCHGIFEPMRSGETTILSEFLQSGEDVMFDGPLLDGERQWIVRFPVVITRIEMIPENGWVEFAAIGNPYEHALQKSG